MFIKFQLISSQGIFSKNVKTYNISVSCTYTVPIEYAVYNAIICLADVQFFILSYYYISQ